MPIAHDADLQRVQIANELPSKLLVRHPALLVVQGDIEVGELVRKHENLLRRCMSASVREMLLDMLTVPRTCSPMVELRER